MAEIKIGKNHPLYRGGKTRDANGYVMLSSKEHGENKGRREHQVVMESKIGRRLMPGELVHHINGIKDDNRPENLEIQTRKSHPRIHGMGSLKKCSGCGSERWYSRSLQNKMTATEYKCRKCRFGKTWDTHTNENNLTRVN